MLLVCILQIPLQLSDLCVVSISDCGINNWIYCQTYLTRYLTLCLLIGIVVVGIKVTAADVFSSIKQCLFSLLTAKCQLMTANKLFFQKKIKNYFTIYLFENFWKKLL